MQLSATPKEKMTVIELRENTINETTVNELKENLSPFLQQNIKNIVLVMSAVSSIDNTGASELAALQQLFYDQNASFVICGLQPGIIQFLDNMELLETMNTTPTESEAWDIVQMEEIERDLWADEEAL